MKCEVQNEANCHYRADPEIGVPKKADSAKRTQFPAGQDTPAFNYSVIPSFQYPRLGPAGLWGA